LAGGLSQVLAKVAGGTIVDYLYGDQRLAALAGGVRSWYGTDGQGSVRQTLSDAGAVLSTQSYDPFGQPEGGTTPSPFGYRGELQDSATSALYLRARWYQPGNGQLLGVDPALDTTGQPYAYAADDPVNGSDPSGLAATGPNTQPTQADIDRLLQSVLDSWPNIVMPSSDRPPGNQPWQYFEGAFVHNRIAVYYANQNSGSVVWGNTITVGRIVAYFGGDVSALSATQRAEKPDIFDLTYRRIYEIKPYTSYGAAVTQLNKYLASFNAAHVYMVHAGASGAPGTRGIVTAPGGYAVFASPANGVILYRLYRGRFRPAASQSTDCSAAALEHAVVTVVVTVFGIVVWVGGQILSPGSSDNPAPALA
jgi:RHS repeat-associated protein